MSGATAMFGPGSTGLDYVLHWVISGRTMEGLSRMLRADIGRPGYTRGNLCAVFKAFGKDTPAKIRAARDTARERRWQYEKEIAAAEAPPVKGAPPQSRPIPPRPFSGPLTIDDLRTARHTGRTAQAPAGT